MTSATCISFYEKRTCHICSLMSLVTLNETKVPHLCGYTTEVRVMLITLRNDRKCSSVQRSNFLWGGGMRVCVCVCVCVSHFCF